MSDSKKVRCRVIGVEYQDGYAEDCESEQCYRVTLQTMDPCIDDDIIFEKLSLHVRRDELERYPFGTDVLLTIETPEASPLLSAARHYREARDRYDADKTQDGLQGLLVAAENLNYELGYNR